MSGTPTLPQVQTQWDTVVSLQESMRLFSDNDAVALLAAIEQSAIGDYTPQGLARETAITRSTLAALVRGARDAAYLQPVIFEWGGLIESPFSSSIAVFRDIYEYCHDNAITVPSRRIIFGVPANAGTNVGTGTLRRLDVDWNGYATEAVRAETKRLRCIADANSGSVRHAEQFTIDGEQPSLDALELLVKGTGPLGLLVARNAGSGSGGSLLRNSSFDQFVSDGSTPTGWELLFGTVAQNPDYYRGSPGSQTPGCVAMTGPATIQQKLEDGARRLDSDAPYFLRVMVKANGASGQLVLTLGGVTKTIADVSTLGAGWVEVAIDVGVDSWFRTFNVEGLPITIDFQGTGTLLVDDGIFTPWDAVDGSFYLLVGSDTPWLVDDAISCTDTGGDPGAFGVRNYHNYLASLGYLPHDNGAGTASWADPVIP